MYFNETNDTNIDDEFNNGKRKRKKKVKDDMNTNTNTEKKEFKFRFTPDTLLMCFYGFLLIVGIVLIIICIN